MAQAISTTAVEIVDSLPFLSIFIKNTGSATVYIGGDDAVTADSSSTGGWPLAPGEVLSLPNRGTETYSMWGITAAGTAYVVAFVL